MLQRKDLNPNALRAQYAVRGPIVDRAQQLEAQGRRIVYCNIGNPQALRQKPVTYLRQLLSLVEYPPLLDAPEVAKLYPPDVVARARRLLEQHPPGTGAYTQSAGLGFVREAVAAFIARRDGIPTDPKRVLLTDGASKGIDLVLQALVQGPATGIMVPVPQYPLYSATVARYGGARVDYALDEAAGWQLTEGELERAAGEAIRHGVRPVAIAVINPGNPTGAVLRPETIAMVARFARRHGLAILADEVYQDNVYAPDARFVSFARVLHDLNERDVSLFSFHSVSKGYLGECGHRGGYLEHRNLAEDVAQELTKLQSISLCSNIPGQIAVHVMVAPPQPGEPSHASYTAERAAILDGLKAKAEILAKGVRGIPGMSLVEPQGAMYAFVRLELPPEPGTDVESMTPERRREHESKRDSAWCLALLEETGICVVPGSGFGQAPGTLHFRTTFLPPREEIEGLVARLRDFHARYVQRLSAAPARP
ncbi:MAG TPA: aminotransferase class I/II-fold pyridoxal phosphate-dependent enzyme [Planctomycetota bacterium]|nr:aminotransferase class I/II-fold pyridoxal phosphate-dependent enzyme [Planctomycetota bacterium]